jgi:hypothetical protein
VSCGAPFFVCREVREVKEVKEIREFREFREIFCCVVAKFSIFTIFPKFPIPNNKSCASAQFLISCGFRFEIPMFFITFVAESNHYKP